MSFRIAFLFLTCLAGSLAKSVDMSVSCKKIATLVNNFFDNFVDVPFPIPATKTPYISLEESQANFIFPLNDLPGECHSELDGAHADISLGFQFGMRVCFPSKGYNLTFHGAELRVQLDANQKNNRKLSLLLKAAEVTNIKKVIREKYSEHEDVTAELKDSVQNTLAYLLQNNAVGLSAHSDVKDVSSLKYAMGIYEEIYDYRLMFDIAALTGLLDGQIIH